MAPDGDGEWIDVAELVNAIPDETDIPEGTRIRISVTAESASESAATKLMGQLIPAEVLGAAAEHERLLAEDPEEPGIADVPIEDVFRWIRDTAKHLHPETRPKQVAELAAWTLIALAKLRKVG